MRSRCGPNVIIALPVRDVSGNVKSEVHMYFAIDLGTSGLVPIPAIVTSHLVSRMMMLPFEIKDKFNRKKSALAKELEEASAERNQLRKEIYTTQARILDLQRQEQLVSRKSKLEQGLCTQATLHAFPLTKISMPRHLQSNVPN